MSPRLKEFLTAWLAGLVVGLATIPFRHAEVGPFLHVLACGGAVGAFAIILLSPNTLIMLAALVALPVSYHFGPKTSFVSYWALQLSASYLGWVVFELLRHQFRLAADPEYRERFERHRRGGG
jgi:hypothetical protein